MVNVAMGRGVGARLAKALNIPCDRLVGFELRCFVDEYVVIKATYIPTVEEVDVGEVENIMVEYELHSRG